MTPITLSPNGANFIKHFEGCILHPYQDTGGIWSVGYGQQISSAQAAQWKNGITQAQADELFNEFINGMTKQLAKSPFVGFFQYQLDAMLSLAYNIGVNGFLHSIIYKQLTIRSTTISPWKQFIYDAHGNVQQGLVRRREAELKLFIYGIYN